VKYIESKPNGDGTITQQDLKEILYYDPETGLFTWKSFRGFKAKQGSIAGNKKTDGYVKITLLGKKRSAHRLAFLYMTGSVPKQVDHINGLRDDNRWSNLRAATGPDNNRNQGMRSDNKSGVKGVCWLKDRCKWVAQIEVLGRNNVIGYFPDLIGAELAVRKAREELHGEFANHG